MKFEDYRIADSIKKSIDYLGYKRPTDIQFKSIPAILKKEDVLAIAQTGTGKTAAFAIPILNNLLERKRSNSSGGVRVLVLAPTHELAQQITDVFNTLGKYTKLTSYCIYGGVDQAPQIAKLNSGVDICIATPGRMFDLISQGALDVSKVEILVLDEADHMLDLGFYKDIRDLLRHIPRRRQTLFFSATINEKIKKLAYSIVVNPIRIQISPKNPVAKNIDHSLAFIEMDDKRFFLEHLVREREDQKILVFVRTKVRAERVKKAMERAGLITGTIHGDKEQKERTATLNAFKSSELKVLITTDVSARGIDIPNVDMVVNYDMPETPENYVHRVGRTGRGREKGLAVSFSSTEESFFLEQIEESIGYTIPRIEMTKKEYELTIEDTKNNSLEDLLAQADREEEEYKKLKKKRRKK